MSSPYTVLNNRPIDQWKVTELKEELKRRKLITRGLKDDLIRRLDEALRVEAENSEKNVDNGVESEQHLAGVKDEGVVPVDIQTPKDVVDGGNENTKVVDVVVHDGVNDSLTDKGQVEVQHEDKLDANDSSKVEETLVHATTVQTSITVTESVVTEMKMSEVDLQNSEIQNHSGGSKSQLDNQDVTSHLGNQDATPQLENDVPKSQLENEDPKTNLENEVLTAPHEDAKLDLTAADNQVSEVSPVLGSQVKSDSISTASMSINETIELKDNLIADNVKLELDLIKPEMVEPSSSSVEGKSHPMDVEEPFENNAPLEEKDDDSARNEDMIKKNDSADLGYSDKLNLDRSSGDDSMEEDVLDSKHIDLEDSYIEVKDEREKNGVPMAEEDITVDIVGDDISVEKEAVHLDAKNQVGLHAEKRKLHEAPGNNEPLKRQRKWNTEGSKVVELQGPNLTPTTTSKDAFQSTSFKRSYSKTDSTANDEAPKERVVLLSQTPPTNSLKVDRFLRPFTLKAVQELLGKTGSVTSFWMDQIKTHCYVTYSSVEEAIQTRDAVYNLQWPPNGGRHLVAEFVDPQEVKIRVEVPQTPITPLGPSTSIPSAPPAHQPAPYQQVPKQQLPPPPLLPPPPPLSSLLPARKLPPPPMSSPPEVRERLPPPPPLPVKMEPPIVTLDDLFRKTKATPRIYYLPLSEEQVAAKLIQNGRNTKQ